MRDREPARRGALGATPARQRHTQSPDSDETLKRLLRLQRMVGNQAVSGLLGSTVTVQRDVGSDDYNQGYQDGLKGGEAAPGPRDGDALTDYNEGYAKGQYEFSQQTQSGGETGPNSSQGPAFTPTPPPEPEQPDQTVATPEDKAAYQEGYTDGQSGAPSDPIGTVGFQYAQDYLNGYAAGKAAGPPAEEQAEGPAYEGPSIGPAPENEGPEGEGPEKPDELPAYEGPEWRQYLQLRQQLRLWRMYKALGDERDAERHEFSEGQRELYMELWTKFVQYDKDPESPPPPEGEAEEMEGESEAVE